MQVLKETVRKNIIQQAELLFYQLGYKETSTRMIAEKTGMHYSSMYRYFRNKESLFDAVVGDFYIRFQSGFRDFLRKGDNASSDDLTAALGSVLFQAVKDDRKKFFILFRRSEGTKYSTFFNEMVSALTEHMMEHDETGSYRVLFETIAGNFVRGVCDLADGCEDITELEDSLNLFVRYHLSGMGAL